MVADGYRFSLLSQSFVENLCCSKKPHMILAAIRAKPPEGWSRVNATLIQQKLKEQEKEVGRNMTQGKW